RRRRHRADTRHDRAVRRRRDRGAGRQRRRAPLGGDDGRQRSDGRRPRHRRRIVDPDRPVRGAGAAVPQLRDRTDADGPALHDVRTGGDRHLGAVGVVHRARRRDALDGRRAAAGGLHDPGARLLLPAGDVMASLFPPELPPGFRYEDAFLTADDETALIARIGEVTFAAFEMRGVVARRRVAFFGQAYDATRPSAPRPDFLLPLRQRAGRWAGVDGDALAMALINEYPPGAPIGWHRDAPQYDVVIGVSLGSPCRMRLRP